MRKIIPFSILLFILPLLLFAQCPSQTTVQGTGVTFVGELTDLGGDNKTDVWFEYGPTSNFGYLTSKQTRYQTGFYCISVSNLSPCTTYYYRAVAQNSGGISYGETKTFTTNCSNVNSSFANVDLKVNGIDGVLTITNDNFVTLHWTTQNVSSCYASGAWSGSKTLSGSETTPRLSFGRYEYVLTCYDYNNNTYSDRVIVDVSGGQVAGAATNISTGLFKDNSFYLYFLPPFLALSFIWFSYRKFLKARKN